jgi:hypothetical protein
MTERVCLGEVYLYEPSDALYRPLKMAYHARQDQDLIVYEGLNGPDEGLWFCCTLNDWSIRFTRYKEPSIPELVVEEKPVEKVAGKFTPGSGF